MNYSQFTTEELAAEVWKPVVGFEGLYSVSNLGRARRDAPCQGTQAGRILAPKLAKDHYQVALHRKPEKPYYRYIHQLVLAAFEGPCPDGQEVSHKDGQPSNNRLNNLQYKTRSEHRQFDAENFGRNRGEQNPGSYLTEANVIAIRERFAAGETTTSLSREFNTSTKRISCIVTGATWKHTGGTTHRPTKPKLTTDDVREIHRRARAGFRQKQLAMDFHVDGSTINKILKGSKHSHIAKEFPPWQLYKTQSN